MAKKLSILFFVLTLVPALMIAQTNVVLRADGHYSKTGVVVDRNEVQPIDKNAVRDHFNDFNNITDLDKVLFYEMPPTGNANFGFFGQDWMVQWFEAPADMIIRRAGVNCIAKDADDLGAELKLVKLAWSKDDIQNIGVKNLGYYPADGNGFNDITAFLDNLDRTGDWVEVNGNGVSPFAEDLWSDFGFGAPITPTPSGAVNVWEWVNMNLLGFEPTVSRGDIIGVAVKNTSATLDGDRIGWLASDNPGVTGFKFYANGRLITGGPGVGDPGWWSRSYTWDFALDVTLTGDVPPDISDVTVLPTTIETTDRDVSATITDENPAGGDAGVASAVLVYRVNGGDWMEVAMTAGAEDVYTGTIPGQEAGTEVEYYVKATDVGGNEATAPNSPVWYKIFLPERPNLLVFNGGSDSGYPFNYYFGPNYAAQDPIGSYLGFDIWAYGPLPASLLENYTNIYEICYGGPADYNNDPVAGAGTGGDETIRDWLAGKSDRNYFLTGMEWLGAWNGFADLDFAEGDFAYDVLGLAHSYNDVSYDGSAGQGDPSPLTLIEGPAANQGLVDAGAANLQFDSPYETSQSNWMDAFDVVGRGTALMNVTTRGIAGAPAVEEHACGVYNETPGGNKVVFLSYDPIAVNSDPDGDHGDNYIWWGYDEANHPYYVATALFGITVSVEQTSDQMPAEFKLSQNYPNPFNPSTIIKFAIPQSEFVTMKVYDVLGREVSTIVNQNLTAGSYEVNFDASDLAAGMYIYQIKAGNFVSAKKMMLLK